MRNLLRFYQNLVSQHSTRSSTYARKRRDGRVKVSHHEATKVEPYQMRHGVRSKHIKAGCGVGSQAQVSSETIDTASRRLTISNSGDEVCSRWLCSMSSRALHQDLFALPLEDPESISPTTGALYVAAENYLKGNHPPCLISSSISPARTDR